MKKLFDKTVKGYYVMSVVLGVLLALAIGEIVEVAVLNMTTRMPEGLSFAEMETLYVFWDNVWCYLPIRLCNLLYIRSSNYGMMSLNLLMVGASILTVWLFVEMSCGKNWRTKAMQALNVTLLVLLFGLVYSWSTCGSIVSTMAVAPVLLMAIPMLGLKKTQQPKEREQFNK